MTGHVTIEVGGAERSLAELGLTDPMLYVRNGAECEFTVRHPGRAFDAEPLFGHGVWIKVRSARTVSGNGFTGGQLIFQGRRTVAPAMAEGAYEGYDYIFENSWGVLAGITYGQKWRTWALNPGGEPTSSYIETSEVNLMTRVAVGTNIVSRITNGEQVRDAVQWAIDHGAALQIGTITPGLYLPVEYKRDLKCSQVIQTVLKLCPDAVVEIDDSTEPPTFNCIQRAQMTPVTVALADEKVTRLKLVRRDDLVVPAVVLKYKRTDQIDGRARVSEPTVDAAPADATGFEDGAIFQTIELFGARVSSVRGTIVSEAVGDLTDVAWWIAHGNAWLGAEGYTNVTVTPAARAGSLPYVLSLESAGVAPWMVDDDDNEAASEMETFEALVSYQANGHTVTNQKIIARVRTTNLASGTYEARELEEAGEVAVAGLAQSILNGLSVVHHDGQVTITEEECSADIRLTNTLSISGGTGRYASMNAVVQEITYDLSRGERVLTLGWPKHLSIDDIIEITRFNRVRYVWHNPNMQGSGELGSDSDVELPDGNPQEDGAAGQAAYQVFTATGAGGTTKLDGVTGAITVTGSAGGGGGGSISAALSDTGGKEIRLREYSFCYTDPVSGQRSTKKVRLLGSDFY